MQNEGPQILNLPNVAYVHEDVSVKEALFDISATDPESDQYTCVLQAIVPSSNSFDVEDATGNKGQAACILLAFVFRIDNVCVTLI